MSDTSSPPKRQAPEMVERVARALCIAMGLPPDHEFREVVGSGFEESVVSVIAWTKFQREARVAIEAMRQPTEPMLLAAGLHPTGHNPFDAWQAMIGAALDE